MFGFFCNNAIHVSDRIDLLRLSSLTHPLRIFIVSCALGLGLINRIWARKIVQLQYIYIREFFVLITYLNASYGHNIFTKISQ